MTRLLVLIAALFWPAAALAQETTLIRGARVFDGTGAPAKASDVLIRKDRVAKVAPRIKPGPAMRVIDAAGMTLIPGLNDLHIHTDDAAFATSETLAEGYQPYLDAGVTTVNEYSVSGPMLAGIRANERGRTPHINLAIRLGVPNGHGTESAFTNGITTQVTTPAEARLAMVRLLRYKPDMIKVFADGWRYGDAARPDKPDMDLPTLTTIVRAAHRHRIPVVTHTVTLAGAKMAARAGVDAVVHGIGDKPVGAELIALMKRHRTAYVPTMTVYEPQEERVFLPEEWRRLSDAARAREKKRKPAAVAGYDAKRWDMLQQNLRRLRAAGIPIGIGTDTGISGVYPGSATIREIRLFVKSGFTSAEALAAATGVGAAIMHQSRRYGRIAKGQRADLILVNGRPDERIEDLYDVRRVFVNGREIVQPR